MFDTSKIRTLIIYLLLITSLSSSQLYAQQAEVVWVEQNNESQSIHISSFDGKRWTPPSTPLFESNNALSSVKLGTDSDGNKLMVWSEQIIDKTALMFSQKKTNTPWVKAKVLYAAGSENYAGSIVFDSNNTGWFFWSFADEQLADILYMRFINGKPSHAQQLHDTNQVPDIHPVAGLDVNGNIEIIWTTYDLEKNRYVRTTKVIPINPQQKLSFINHDELKIEDIPIPNFIPNKALSLIHMPGIRMTQSAPVER